MNLFLKLSVTLRLCEAETVIESFKTVGVAPVIVGAVQSGTDIESAAEYISLLFREVRAGRVPGV